MFEIEIGDLVTSNCLLIYPSFVVKEGDKGKIVAKITRNVFGVKWYNYKNYNIRDIEYHVINLNRGNIKPYYEYLPDSLFEI